MSIKIESGTFCPCILQQGPSGTLGAWKSEQRTSFFTSPEKNGVMWEGQALEESILFLSLEFLTYHRCL